MGQTFYFDIFYSLILADNIVIYLPFIIVYENLLKYISYSATIAMKIIHSSTLRVSSDSSVFKSKIYGVWSMPCRIGRKNETSEARKKRQSHIVSSLHISSHRHDRFKETPRLTLYAVTYTSDRKDKEP